MVYVFFLFPPNLDNMYSIHYIATVENCRPSRFYLSITVELPNELAFSLNGNRTINFPFVSLVTVSSK